MVNNHTTSLPGLIEPNKTISAVVGYNNAQTKRPQKEAVHREVILQGDDKKLDTQIVVLKEPWAPSVLVGPGLAEVISQKESKGTIGIMNDSSVLLAKTSLQRGVKKAQAPNQETLRSHNGLNPEYSGTRDATAST
jgi:hypothetical protein